MARGIAAAGTDQMPVIDPIAQAKALAAGFAVQTRKPATSFLTRSLPPPSQLYVSENAFLRITVTGALANQNMLCRARLLRSADGEITEAETPLRGSNSVLTQVATITLTEGFLLFSQVQVTSGTVKAGSVFVRVELDYGGQVDAHTSAILMQGYITTNCGVAWPGGRLINPQEGNGGRVRVVPTGEGQRAIHFSGQINRIYQYKCIVCNVVTDATPGNRQVAMLHITSTIGGPTAINAAAQPPSTQWQHEFHIGYGAPYNMPYPGSEVGDAIQVCSLPEGVTVHSGDDLSFWIVGFGPGDQFLAGYNFGYAEQWLDI